MKTVRWKTLDIIKAMTVPSMIIVHNSIWWLSYHHFAIASAMGSWFLVPRLLAFFVMLVPATAGAALFFYLKQHRNEGLPVFTYILKRAIFLSLAGFVMNFLAFGLGATLQWNVLQFFSVSMVIIYLFIRFLNTSLLFMFGALALFAAPLLRNTFSPRGDFYLYEVMLGSSNATHLWPFFPWFSIVVCGFLIASLFHNVKLTNFLAKRLMFIGGLLMLLAHYFGVLFYSIDFQNLWGEVIFQPPTMQVLGTIGVLLLTFGLIHQLFNKSVISPFSIVASLSAGLFYIYIFHMIVGHQIQLHFLKDSSSIFLLWVVIVMQLILAYLIGVMVQYLKSRRS